MEEGGIFVVSDPEPCGGVGVAGQKTKRGKVVKGDSASVGVGASQKKLLADITNMHQQQQRLQPFNQQAKQHSAPLATADQLLNENAMLMKLLANRNAIIESCKAELQKSQRDFQKLRKQNSELAQTNTQMLVELNSSRQRLRELQHELGSKNGILRAMKLEVMAKENTEKLKHEIDADEVGASQNMQSDQTFQHNREGAKRKRVSKSQPPAPAVIKQVKSTEKVENQRCCLRRQSARFKAEKPGPREDFFEADQIKYDVSHLEENLANENGPTSLGSKVHEKARENAESSGPTNTEQAHAKKNVEKKRHSLRRQSASFRPESPEPTEDLFEVDDAKFAISHLGDNMSEKSRPTTSSVTSGQENNSSTVDPQEIRRSSVGRPLRRTVEKVVSYKEVPLNVKMRRDN
ncbi:shugoshin-1 [Gastrolobium bilobum]|uniref:shugoshin-1 n=1 Tax=Gastrolobium bilobum TaxID=150636 RepID=UPI002AB0BC73|nr:shugoshin-1 [Gastrolobium bilobum]